MRPGDFFFSFFLSPAEFNLKTIRKHCAKHSQAKKLGKVLVTIFPYSSFLFQKYLKMRPLCHQPKIAVLENNNHFFIMTYPCTFVVLLRLSDSELHTRLMVCMICIFRNMLLSNFNHCTNHLSALFKKEVLYFICNCS